jgi:NADPH2:quinone reductase
MKAAIFDQVGEPDVLRYADVPDPALRRGGLILEVRAIGIQGGDLINRREGKGLDQPHVVGYQASGVVREVGEGVTAFAPGDRVVAMMMKGSHAELVSVSARKVWALPDTVSFEDAASLPVEFGTAADCLFEFGHLAADETVLVQAGSGGVGLAAIQLARAAGATVITTSVTADGRLERLLDHGADHVLDYTQVDVVTEVLRLTEDRGVDLVVDPIGGRTLEGSIAALAYRGRISWIGNAGRYVEPPTVWPLMEKNGTLTGVFFALEQARQPQRAYDLIAGLIARVGTGELRAVLDRQFALADAVEAHRYVETGVAFGRVLMIP